MNSSITIGNYKRTAYTFINGSRVVTLTGLDDFVDISRIKLFANQTQNKLYGAKSFWNGNVTSQNVVATAPTVGTATAGGAVTAGTHQYKVVFLYATGERSLASPASSVITVVTNTQTVPLTNIITGNSSVVAREIYRTAAGGSSYLLLATISDNTTTTYSDIITDASLSNAEPFSSGAVVDITLTTAFDPLVTGDILDIEVEVSNSTEDDDLGIVKTLSLDAADLPPADPEIGAITDTNLAINTYYYDIPQSLWKNLVGQIKATCSTDSSVIRVFATLDPAAAIPATGGTPSVDWADITQAVFGASQINVPITGTYISPMYSWSVDENGNPVMYYTYLIQYKVLNATNFINVNIRKW